MSLSALPNSTVLRTWRIMLWITSVPLWLKASRLKLAAKAVELGGSRLLLKEKKFSRVVSRS